MSTFLIKHDSGEKNGTIFLYMEGKKVGHVNYVWEEENTIRATHTFVPRKYRGQKIGEHLFKALMDFVGEKNLNLIPECPYIELRLRRAKSQEI